MVTHNNNNSTSRRSKSRENNDGNVDDDDRSESEEMVSAHLRQAKVSVLTALQEQYDLAAVVAMSHSVCYNNKRNLSMYA